MSRNRGARNRSRSMLRNLLVDVATFTVAAAAAAPAGLLALGVFLTLPYFVSSSSELMGQLVGEPATPNAAPAYIWWVAIIAGLIVGLQASVVVFWKVEPIASRYLHDRFGEQPPTYPLDGNQAH